jgi:hypothetical protein
MEADLFADLAQGVQLAVPYARAHTEDETCAVVEVDKLSLAEAVEGQSRQLRVQVHPGRFHAKWRNGSGSSGNQLELAHD